MPWKTDKLHKRGVTRAFLKWGMVMKIRILAVLATVLAGTGLAAAEPGSFGSMSVFEKCKQRGCAPCAAPCEPCCVPTHMIAAPKVFRAEVDRPTYIEGKPLAPVHLIRAVPPGIELMAARPPSPQLMRATPPPIELVGAQPPPVSMFRLQPEPLRDAPPVQFPSVRLFRIPQPPAPCCPPPVCAPCCTADAH